MALPVSIFIKDNILTTSDTPGIRSAWRVFSWGEFCLKNLLNLLFVQWWEKKAGGERRRVSLKLGVWTAALQTMKSKQAQVLWDWLMCLKTQRGASKRVSGISKPRSGTGFPSQTCAGITPAALGRSPQAPPPSPTTPTRTERVHTFQEGNLRCQHLTGTAQPHRGIAQPWTLKSWWHKWLPTD